MDDKNNADFSALDRQRKIYIRGISGQRPNIPLDFKQLEAKAAHMLSPEAFTYISGGAGLGETIQNNRSGFGKWKIIPRMMRDVSTRQKHITLFGQRIAAPLILSPVGVLELAHPQADAGARKAAATMGIPYIFSNQASKPLEEVMAATDHGPVWFQLYWSKSNDLVASFLERAERSGCSAIVVTLDTTLLGWRIPDLNYAFLPFLQGKGIAQYTSDPVFQRLIDESPGEESPTVKPKLSYDTLRSVFQLMSNYPGSFMTNLRSRRPLKAVQKFIDIYSRPSLSWEDLPFLRKHTQLPILLKGILHPDDAKLAVDNGVDGIIVSNHGGRQVDGAISSIQALAAIADAVNGQIPILMDGGIRTGADMFKALALGAKAVCIGRPYAYGLAIGGEEGVREVIQNLIADFELTMGLSGCKSVAEIQKECLTL